MERKATLKEASLIFKKNFIGLEELEALSNKAGIFIPESIKKDTPPIPFTVDFLNKMKDKCLLILGIPYYKDGTPLSIAKMREHFGWNPETSEPCFYNQDWYLNEAFANTCSIENKWYLLNKNVKDETRGIPPEIFLTSLRIEETLPPALLTAYCFFVYYLLNPDEILWQNDYIWCADFDHNNDRIYTARYLDLEKVNKNGFSVHRHLQISNAYGSIIHY